MALNQEIIDYFEGKEVDIKTYSPLTFAYIGDDVFDLVIRTIVVNKGNTSPNNDEEQDVLRRGRNSKPHTKAKNASSADYMKATALETLIGYLYLRDDMERIFELIKTGINKIEEENER